MTATTSDTRGDSQRARGIRRVFSSKREDGSYTRLYLACVDDNGRVSKPFLLPQRNPKKYYSSLFDAYNVPDFTKTKVCVDVRELQRQVTSGERVKVKIR